MEFLIAAWQARKLVAMGVAVLAVMAVIGYVGHLRREVRISAIKLTIATQQLDTAVQANADNERAFAEFKARMEANQSAVLADLAREKETAAFIERTRQGISHDEVAIGPDSSRVLGELRGRRAAKDNHQDGR